MPREYKAAFFFVVLGLLCVPAADRIRLQDPLDESRNEAEMRGRDLNSAKSRLSKLEGERVLNEVAARAESLEAKARSLDAILALVSAGLAFLFLAFLLLIQGSLRGADVDGRRRRLWIYAAALAASLPGGVVALRWWLGGFGWQSHGPAADWLAASGLAVALAGLWIPSRTRRAPDLSWSRELAPLARAPRLVLWGLANLFFAAHGGKAVRVEGKSARLDGPELRRHAGLAAGLAAGLVCVLGLLAGNIGRLSAAFGDAGLLLVPILLLAAAWRLRRPGSRWSPSWPCPHCKAEMRAADVHLGLAGSFLGLRRCPSCSGLTTDLGAAAGPDLPASRDLLKPWLGVAAATWAGALAGFLAAGCAWDAAGARSLAAARERALAAGFPIDLPRQRPAPPDGENSVKLYEKAAQGVNDAKLDLRFFNNKSEDAFAVAFLANAARGAVSPEETAAARRLVAKHSALLALLEAGAARPQEHWGIDWDHRPEFEIKIPKYSGLLRLQKLLACRAALAAADGRSKAALKDARLGLALARSVESEPMLFSVMVAASMSNTMLDAAMPVLSRVPTALARREILPLLSADRLTAGFHRSAALQHYAMTGWLAELSWADAWRGRPEVSEEIPWLYWPFIKFDLAAYYRGSLEFDEALSRPFPASKAAWEKASERFERDAWIYGRAAMPRFDHLQEKVLAAQARQRLALASFAVRAFKEKEKRWPDGLWEVGPITDKERSLQDPFTGGPFKALRSRGGLLIYSVGPDGVDDQGAPYVNDSMKGDLSWRL